MVKMEMFFGSSTRYEKITQKGYLLGVFFSLQTDMQLFISKVFTGDVLRFNNYQQLLKRNLGMVVRIKKRV